MDLRFGAEREHKGANYTRVKKVTKTGHLRVTSNKYGTDTQHNIRVYVCV